MLTIHADGSFHLNMDYFSYHYSPERTFNDRFVRLWGEPRVHDTEFFCETTGHDLTGREAIAKRNQYYADVAASIQRLTEEMLLKMVNHLHEQTGLEHLVMAGGVGLNSVANGRIMRESPFEQVFIQPAAGDAGGALGAALYAYHVLLQKPRRFIMEHAYYGEAFDEDTCRQFLEINNIPYEFVDDEQVLVDRVSDALVSGQVIGLFQGRFEWGPRALGNRSILADPRTAEMKNIVNVKIKFREPFRPFAPVVPEERAAEFFDLAASRRAVSAALHADGQRCAGGQAGDHPCRLAHGYGAAADRATRMESPLLRHSHRLWRKDGGAGTDEYLVQPARRAHRNDPCKRVQHLQQK